MESNKTGMQKDNNSSDLKEKQHASNEGELKPFLLAFINDLLNNQPTNVLEYMISWSALKMQEEKKDLVLNSNNNKVNGQKEILQQQKVDEEHNEKLQGQIQQIVDDFNEMAHDYIDYFKAYADGARDRYMLELEDSFYGIEELRVLEDDMHMHRAKLFEVIDMVNKAKERLEELEEEKMSNTHRLNVVRTFYETEKAKFEQLGDIHSQHVH